jgi:SAM-dependent methyltransferase
MRAEGVFAPTRHVEDLAECYFYHVMNLPGHGVVGSEWDLRGKEDDYLGGVSFQGKRVLELGTASGFLCRAMEARGADVIAFDLSPEQSWDVVPFAALDTSTLRARMKAHIQKLNNGWWFAHRVFESKARVVYGDIYDIPEAIGPVDIATFGAILLHLRSPFDALHSALRLTRETVVVTDVHPEQPSGSPLGTVAKPHGHPGTLYFLPDWHATDPNTAVTWWCLPPRVICQFLGVLGFESTAVTEHLQTFCGKRARMYTVVGTRTKGFLPR